MAAAKQTRLNASKKPVVTNRRPVKKTPKGRAPVTKKRVKPAPPQPPAPEEKYVGADSFLDKDNRRFKTRKEKILIDFAHANDVFKSKGGAIPEIPSAQLVGAICALVRHGHNILPSAVALGVGRQQFEGWWVKGLQDPVSEYGKMISAIEAAEAQGEILDIERINRDPRATNLMWKRERRSAARWGNKNQIQVSVPELPTQEKAQPTMSIDESAMMLGLLESIGYLAPQQIEEAKSTGLLPAAPEVIDVKPEPEKEPEKEVSLADKYV